LDAIFTGNVATGSYAIDPRTLILHTEDDVESQMSDVTTTTRKRKQSSSTISSTSKPRSPRQTREDNVVSALQELVKTSRVIQDSRIDKSSCATSNGGALEQALEHFQEKYTSTLNARERFKIKQIFMSDENHCKLYNACDEEEKDIFIEHTLSL
jgi:hypothetical protein